MRQPTDDRRKKHISHHLDGKDCSQQRASASWRHPISQQCQSNGGQTCTDQRRNLCTEKLTEFRMAERRLQLTDLLLSSLMVRNIRDTGQSNDLLVLIPEKITLTLGDVACQPGGRENDDI